MYNTFLACLPASDNTNAQTMASARSDCYEPAVVTYAATTPAPFDLFVAIRAMNETRPDVFTMCHNSAHVVGKIAYDRLAAAGKIDAGSLTGLVGTADKPCMGGLVHGVYDALGLSEPTLDDFRASIEACRDLTDIVGYCADAVGHASWDAHENQTESARICSWWIDRQQVDTCAEGVLMRTFQRREPDDAFYTGSVAGTDPVLLDRWVDEIVALCGTWPTQWPAGSYSEPPYSDPRHGCWKGSVYLLVKPLGGALERNGNIYSAARTEILRLVPELDAACGRFETGADYCRSHFGPYFAHFSTFDTVAAHEMCALLSDLDDICVREADDRINAAFNGR